MYSLLFLWLIDLRGDKETEAILWNQNGIVLSKVNSHQFKNYFGAISPDSNLLSIGTFTSDTLVSFHDSHAAKIFM